MGNCADANVSKETPAISALKIVDFKNSKAIDPVWEKTDIKPMSEVPTDFATLTSSKNVVRIEEKRTVNEDRVSRGAACKGRYVIIGIFNGHGGLKCVEYINR